jgi:hypothetical protein
MWQTSAFLVRACFVLRASCFVLSNSLCQKVLLIFCLVPMARNFNYQFIGTII